MSVDTLSLIPVSLNQMKRSILLLFAFAIFSCKHGQYKFNPEAKRLNDSAVKMQGTIAGFQLKASIGKDSFGRMQLALLNKATKIDSNYLTAYFNKFGIQYSLQKYADALVTGKEMIRLAPKDMLIKLIVGKAYDQTGDSVQAKSYYKDYLYYCDGKLAFMPANDKERKQTELQKALVLILLNEPQQGHAILSKLYNESDNDDMSRAKDIYGLYMRLTKSDLLVAKDISVTSGNHITSINTSFP